MPQSRPRRKKDLRDLVGFKEALRHELGARDLTQVELAEQVGCSQSQVSTWLNGSSVPNPLVLDQIEVALELSPGELTRFLGFLPLSYANGRASSVREAVKADAKLSEEAMDTLMVLYVHLASTSARD